jgi:hypothetical protein
MHGKGECMVIKAANNPGAGSCRIDIITNAGYTVIITDLHASGTKH